MYQQLLQLFALCLFAGTTCGVFYIPGSVVSYPKMGKRAFYTNATGNRYPLMGRRSSSSSSSSSAEQDSRSQDGVVGAMLQDNNDFNKRGVFTQGPHRSFPRVGRSGGGRVDNSNSRPVNGRIRSEALKDLLERLSRNVVDAGDVISVNSLLGGQRQQSGDSSNSGGEQLSQFMFLVFDEDGDNMLSKSEFSAGLAKVVEENLLC